MQIFSGCTMFPSADFRGAYYMMALDPDSREFTVITNPDNGRRMGFTRAVMGSKLMGVYLHQKADRTTREANAPDTVVKRSVADDILMGTRYYATRAEY